MCGRGRAIKHEECAPCRHPEGSELLGCRKYAVNGRLGPSGVDPMESAEPSSEHRVHREGRVHLVVDQSIKRRTNRRLKTLDVLRTLSPPRVSDKGMGCDPTA